MSSFRKRILFGEGKIDILLSLDPVEDIELKNKLIEKYREEQKNLLWKNSDYVEFIEKDKKKKQVKTFKQFWVDFSLPQF